MSVSLVFLVGCVAGADGPSPTDPHAVTTTTVLPTTTTTVTLEQGLAEYRGCLDAHGVAIGEIRIDGLGRPRMAMAMAGLDFSDRAVLDALDACGSELSSGALDLGADSRLRDLVQARLEDFATCVRDHGVPAFPAPAPDFNGLGSPFPVNRIPWTDAGLTGAVDACSELLGPASP